MPTKPTRYKHKDSISYTLGKTVTMELLLQKPKTVEAVFLSAEIEQNENTVKLRDLCVKHNIPIEINEKAFNILSPKGNCFVIGMFRKYEAQLLNESHLLFVNPSDSGNMGTIIRTALGFGIKNIAIIKPAVDIFDPKTIRASMGAIFKVNLEYFDDIDTYRRKFFAHNLYAFMLDAVKPLQKANFSEPYTLIFGNEASGLPSEFADFCETVVIPHSNEIDSLNLPIAVGISLYSARSISCFPFNPPGESSHFSSGR